MSQIVPQFHPKIRLALGAAADDHHITIGELIYGPKTEVNVAARRDAVRNLSKFGYGASQIGRILRKHHTTILHYGVRLRTSRTPGPIPCPDLSGEWAI